MVQPQDYMHKSGLAGLTIQNYAARPTHGTGTCTLSNFMLAQPFFTGDEPLDLAGMGIYCSATGTANQRLGIYECTSTRNLYPGALLYDLGTVTYGGTGERLASLAMTLAMTLPAGQMFWLVSLSDAGSGTHYSISSSNPSSVPSGVLGASGTSPPNTVATHLQVARTFASGLPATFPAGATVAGYSGALPAILLDPAPGSPPPPGGGGGGGTSVSTASAVALEITGTVTNPDGREALVYNYSNAADAPSAISYHAAVAVSGRIGDGVLRAGGKNSSGAAVSTISFYDQSLDAWSSISNAIHPACWGLLAIPVRDAGGDLVIILSGGQTAAATGTAVTSRVETSSGVATVVAGPTDSEVRALHAGCAIDDHTAMWCGGWDPTGAATAVRASTFVVGYDGTTYTSGPLSVARRDHKVIAIGNGRALAIGGYGRVLSRETANRAVHEVELFDLRTKTWIPCGRLRVPRVSPLVEMVGDRVYVAGGWSDYTAETIETSVEVLDLKTMKWGVADGASLSLGIHNASCVVSGAIFSYGSQTETDVGSNLAHMLLPGADRRSSPKGLTGLFRVKSATTSSMVLESETGHYATGALSDLTPLSAREEWGGPYVWDNGGHAVSGVTALTQSLIPWHGRVAVLDLDDATSFPDAEGWVVFNFGKENEVGPVKYLGRVSDTAISLDFSFVFDQEVPANSDVTLLVNRGALDTTGLPNSFYITDSSSGRVAAESFIRQAVMAGPELNIRVKYPSDVGLGNAGRPAAGTAKITDAVRVWGSNDVDSDVVVAQGEEDV